MGRIIFETSSITHSLEKSDEEVLKFFEKLTGIKVAFREVAESIPESIEKFAPIDSKPFTYEMLPPRDKIIEYVKNHLDGFSVATSLEHFFGYAPRYGESKEQNRVIGTYSARLLRAREVVAKSEGGKFELVQRGPVKLFVFKKDTAGPTDKPIDSESTIRDETANEETTHHEDEEETTKKNLFEF